MYIEFGLLIIAAYLAGSIPAAYTAAKLYKGIDLRKFGSGNVGAGNLLDATHSKTLTAIVTIWDLGKGALMVWTARTLGLDIAYQVIVGLAAIAGHNWSVFLNFSAGRGMITTAGVAFYLMPWATLVFASVASLTLLRRASPLPVLLAVAALPVASWVIHEPVAVTWGLLAMFVMMVIRRLTAPRTSDVPVDREFLLNRLLYDRDIRDGKTWTSRRLESPPEADDKKD